MNQIERDFKKAVTAAKNRRDMFWRSQAPGLASMLTLALEELKEKVQDPQVGVEALIGFFKRDAEIFERCDDSFGNVGDVFRIMAPGIFVDFARQCADKDKIADQILDLQDDDGYGVRDALIDKAANFLNKSGVRLLIDKVERRIPTNEEITRQRKWLYMIESLARQIKDGELFERTRQRNWQELNGRAYIEIAEVYFSSGDAASAYDRLQKAAQSGGKNEYKYSELFRDVCLALGKKEEVEKISWDIFRSCRCMDTLNELIAQIGEDKRTEIVYKEVDLILAAKEFDVTDTLFLLDISETKSVQSYILDRRDQLDGEQYYSLAPLAEKLEEKGLYLAATVVNRALLEANLKRALSKYYSHGVRYLRKLDALANQIKDWGVINPHSDYVQDIKQKHSLKPAFWAKYG